MKHIKFVKFVLGHGFAPNRRLPVEWSYCTYLVRPSGGGDKPDAWQKMGMMGMVIRSDDRWDGPGWLQLCLAFSVLVPFNSI
jgi:hypothetical protein